jgi:stage V sporulation protein R
MANFAQPNEFIDHADMMSKVLAGGALNPYALGKLIWEDIKERWDKGRFGREWELCKDPEKKRRWDTKANLGTEKIFEVRRTYNDVMFLSEFFTPELFEKLKLFTYEYIPETGAYHITSRNFEDVKKKLLLYHTNLGRPTIKVATGNYGNKGELLLLHFYNGVGLHLEDAKAVLKNIYAMWGRPVNLKTIIKRKVKDPDPMRNRIHPEHPMTSVYEEQGVLLRYDGESFREIALSPNDVKDIRLDEDYSTIPREWIG